MTKAAVTSDRDTDVGILTCGWRWKYFCARYRVMFLHKHVYPTFAQHVCTGSANFDELDGYLMTGK